MFLSPHGLDPADEGPAAILFRALMRDHDLAAWADAIEVDKTLHDGVRGIRGEPFVHRSRVPLNEADRSTSCRTDARGCGKFDDKELRSGGQSVPPPLRAAALRLLRLPFLPRRASRIPEIPACGRRYAHFSDALHLFRSRLARFADLRRDRDPAAPDPPPRPSS